MCGGFVDWHLKVAVLHSWHPACGRPCQSCACRQVSASHIQSLSPATAKALYERSVETYAHSIDLRSRHYVILAADSPISVQRIRDIDTVSPTLTQEHCSANHYGQPQPRRRKRKGLLRFVWGRAGCRSARHVDLCYPGWHPSQTCPCTAFPSRPSPSVQVRRAANILLTSAKAGCETSMAGRVVAAMDTFLARSAEKEALAATAGNKERGQISCLVNVSCCYWCCCCEGDAAASRQGMQTPRLRSVTHRARRPPARHGLRARGSK